MQPLSKAFLNNNKKKKYHIIKHKKKIRKNNKAFSCSSEGKNKINYPREWIHPSFITLWKKIAKTILTFIFLLPISLPSLPPLCPIFRAPPFPVFLSPLRFISLPSLLPPHHLSISFYSVRLPSLVPVSPFHIFFFSVFLLSLISNILSSF